MRVSHQNLLFGLQAHRVVLQRVVAANACAVGTAEPVVGEALAVEFEAARLAAIAWLMDLLRLSMVLNRYTRVLVGTSKLVHRLIHTGDRVVIEIDIAAVQLDCLTEGVVEWRDGRLNDLEQRDLALSAVAFLSVDFKIRSSILSL